MEDKKDKKLGSARLVKSNKNEHAEFNKDSKQLSSAEHKKYYIDQHIIAPPYDPVVLIQLLESNPIYSAIVNQIATDVAGRGWSLISSDKDKDYTEIEKWLESTAKESTFTEVIKDIIEDLKAIGWAGIEIIRNNAGKIVEILRVPAHTLRVHEDKTKYAQIRANKKVWFKQFGVAEDIRADNGMPTTDKSEAANEIIYLKESSLRSDYYGIPRVVSAYGDLIGLIESRDYNISFFSNHGEPNSIITLEGDWEDGVATTVEEFMRTQTKGAEAAHKTLVMECPDGCRINYTPIGERLKDSSFRMYQQDNRENLLIAYSMPPQRLGIYMKGSLSGDSTAEANDIYKAAVVEPAQNIMERIINNLIADNFESPDVKFSFADIDLSDVQAESERLTKLVASGIMTQNEARKELGLPLGGPECDVLRISTNAVDSGIIGGEV